MKRSTAFVCAILAVILVCGLAFAASSYTITRMSDPENGQKAFLLAVTADTDGSISDITTGFDVIGYITQIEYIPDGTTPPTADLLDITIKETLSTGYVGKDIAEDSLLDLANDAPTRLRPKSGTDAGVFVHGALTFAFANNAVNGAKFVIRVIYY